MLKYTLGALMLDQCHINFGQHSIPITHITAIYLFIMSRPIPILLKYEHKNCGGTLQKILECQFNLPALLTHIHRVDAAHVTYT